MAIQKVVIIGSGLGGLSAGVILAQHGLDVTILEKQKYAGGYAAAFSRNGFTFDIALHAIPCGGRGELFHATIQQLGLESDVSFVPLVTPMKIYLGNKEFDISYGSDSFYVSCEKYFPALKHEILRFKRVIDYYGTTYGDIINGTGHPFSKILRFIPNIPAFFRHLNEPTDVFLTRYLSDSSLRSLAFQTAIFHGIAPSSFPAINFIMMFSMITQSGMYTIKGGGQALTTALTQKFTALGGKIRYSESASTIDIENGRAKTVVTRSGNRYNADAVIANINAPALINTLIGRKHFTSSFLSHVDDLTPSVSVLQLFAGLNCTLAEAGVTSPFMVAFPDSDIGTAIKNPANNFAPTIVSLVAPQVDIEPHVTRPVVSAVCCVNGKQWLDLPASEYAQAKAAAQAHILSLLDARIPGFSSHCQVTSLATPHTFSRYTDNPEGAILGFSCATGMHRHMRAISKPLCSNVYTANAWTDMLGGFLQAIRCGVRAAKSVLKTL